jgi:predicted amidohydrolase
MPRIIRIATSAIATFEDTPPPFNLRHPDPGATLALGLSLLDTAGRQGVDLACLPEGFLGAGLPASRLRGVAEPIPGPTFDAIAGLARTHRMNVVAGLFTIADGRLYNIAVLIGRDGQLIGSYAKRHPTEGEIEGGVTPGRDAAVFETDFGRVGLAICFDINWPALWSELKAQGAELVCWLSAYEGGLPLRALAWTHQLPIVTSVWPYHARIVERTGKIAAETSRWSQLALAELDLDKRLFHTDGQAQHILAMQARYGSAIRVESFSEEHVFTLESRDPALSLDEVIAAFGLVEYEAYIARCTAAQQEARRPLASAPA